MNHANRMHSLDGLRGIAAIAVAIYHCNGSLIPGGNLAVDFFFCLSGFVIALSYGEKLQQGMDFRLFAELRLARLYPMILVGALLGVVLHGGRPIILFLLPDPTADVMFPSNPPFWSLFNELLINFAFALVLFRLSTRNLAIIMLTSAICLSLFLYFSAWDGGLGPKWGNFHIGIMRTTYSFVVGILLFRLWKFRGTPRRQSTWALLIPVLFVALLLFEPLDTAAGKLAAILLIIPALVWAGITLEVGCKALFARLGDLSYPLYCIHMPIIYFVSDDLTMRLAAVIACIGAAFLLDRFYDKPARTRLAAIALQRAHRRELAVVV